MNNSDTNNFITRFLSEGKPVQDRNFLLSLRIIVVLISSILSVLLLSKVELINRDGFFYIELSETYLNEGFSAALNYYGWPFFSILGGVISQVSGLSVEYSFYALSVLFFGIIAYAFIRVSEFYFDKKGLLLAAVVFLCATTVNSYRDQIIRDHGYWAFTLMAVYYLCCAVYFNSFKNFFLSQIFVVLSAFFRVEGVVNFFLFPSVYLIFSESARFFIRSNKLIITVLLITLSIFVFAVLLSDSSVLRLLSDVRNYMDLKGYVNNFIYDASIINEHLLPKFSADYSVVFILSGLASILVIKMLASVGVAYLFAATIYCKAFFYWLRTEKLISAILMVLLFPLILFVFRQYFLSTRYAVMVSIMLLIPVTYVFYKGIFQDKNQFSKWFLAFFILYSCVDGLVSFNHTSKAYFHDAVEWVEENLEGSERLISNDQRLSYLLSGVYLKAPLYSEGDIYSMSVDVLILSIGRRDVETEKQVLNSGLWKKDIEFANNKNDHVVIYSRIK